MICYENIFTLDKIYIFDNIHLKVESMEMFRHSNIFKVYNLYLSDFHTQNNYLINF